MQRIRVPELMDDPSLPEPDHRLALDGLKRLNVLSGATNSLWKALQKIENEFLKRPLSQISKTAPIRVLDIATGSGDTVIELDKLASAALSGPASTKRFAFTGLDISETAVRIATANAKRAGADVTFAVQNIFDVDEAVESYLSNFDVVMTSLFTHHLDPHEVRNLFERIHRSSVSALLVNDLVRNSFSYAAVWMATRLVTTSHVVHFDGPVSVRAAYTPSELLKLASEAGLTDSSIDLQLPCRQLLHWIRPTR